MSSKKPPNTGPQQFKSKSASGRSDHKDPCTNENKPKKEYVVYFGIEIPANKYYTGRSSGEVGKDTNSILTGRLSTGYPAGKKYPKRNIQKLYAIHTTDKYNAMRGAEEKHQKWFAKQGVGAAQDNPISPSHKDKTRYEDCAKKTFPDCPVCSA